MTPATRRRCALTAGMVGSFAVGWVIGPSLYALHVLRMIRRNRHRRHEVDDMLRGEWP